jgi:hypothetical protein
MGPVYARSSGHEFYLRRHMDGYYFASIGCRALTGGRSLVARSALTGLPVKTLPGPGHKVLVREEL